VKIKAGNALPKPISLAQIKSNPLFAEFSPGPPGQTLRRPANQRPVQSAHRLLNPMCRVGRCRGALQRVPVRRRPDALGMDQKGLTNGVVWEVNVIPTRREGPAFDFSP